MAQASGVEKASFESLDGGGTFVVQFNPKELKLDEKASWKASDEHGAAEPELTYEKGEPTSLSMELIFDTTVSGGGDVNATYIKPLRAFMTASYADSGAAAATGGGANKRPTYVKFRWGQFEFDGVVEKVNASFLMFDSGGVATRAKVQVGLKERVRDASIAFGAGGGGVSLTAGLGGGFGRAGVTAGSAKTYEVKEGDTLTSVAAKTGAESRNIAEANGLGDPLNLTPGEKLVIPMNEKLAKVLGKRRQNEPVRNYKDTEAPTPFDESRAHVRNDKGPSALDETNPVGVGYDAETGDFANAYISFGPEYEGGSSSGDDAIGVFGASGSGEGVGAHSQHGANPAESGPGAERSEYDAKLGDGSVGEYGAGGSGEGVGAHSQHGANPLAAGEGASATEYDAKVGDGSIGQYGAGGSGEGVGAHSQHGANPLAGGEGAEAATYDASVGDGSVGEYGAAGSGEGRGAHAQHGANPAGEGMGAQSAGSGSGEVGDDAIGKFGARGAGDGKGEHSQHGANPTGGGEGVGPKGAGGGPRGDGSGGMRGGGQDANGDGIADRAQRGGGEGGGKDAAGGGRRENGPAGSVDVDTDKMREDNKEADAAQPRGDLKGPKGDLSKRDAMKHVKKKMEENGEKPENVSDLKRGAKAMGLGEVIRQAKDNADDNPSE